MSFKLHNFNREVLASTELGSDKKFVGALPELLDDGDDKHQIVQGPSASIKGRQSTYSLDHGHSRNGETIFYGNPGQSEDEMIATLDGQDESEDDDSEDMDEQEAIEDSYARLDENGENEEGQEDWHDVLQEHYQLQDAEEYFNRDLETADGETDQQAKYDTTRIRKTQAMALRKTNQEANSKGMIKNKNGVTTKKIKRVNFDGTTTEVNLGRYQGPYPSKPQQKEIDRLSLKQLRKEIIDREVAKFDDVTKGVSADSVSRHYTVPEEDLHKLEKGI